MRLALVLILAAAPAFAQSGSTAMSGDGGAFQTGTTGGVYMVKPQPGSIMIMNGGRQVLRIDPKGAIFWKGREVKGDREFRRAMLDVRRALTEGCRQ